MPLPPPRTGSVLQVKERELPFSFFPVTRDKRRYGLFDVVFAANPWTVMHGAVVDQLKDRRRDEAVAFLEQARDFYEAATGRLSANPLLVYYSFLNLAKAVILVRGFEGTLDRASHGLHEANTGGSADLEKSSLKVEPTNPNRARVFPLLLSTLGYAPPAPGQEFPIRELLPQVAVGHRLWREATRRSERLIGLDAVQIAHAPATKSIWLRLLVPRGDLARYSISHRRLLEEGGLDARFREVRTPADVAPGQICLEQEQPVTYAGRPTDKVMELVDMMRPLLWRILTTDSAAGYRKYYVQLSPASSGPRLAQLGSLWALTFYFGSVVRYRPHVFKAMMNGRYGAFIAEFVGAQPEQMLYMMASEMLRREVAKPAII